MSLRALLPGVILLVAAVSGMGCVEKERVPAAAAAVEDESHAGLLVEHGDGSVSRRCVSFPGESVSGYELLERSGLDFRAEYVRSLKAYAVCRVDGEGCDFPDQRCFCRSSFWSLWVAGEGGWGSVSKGLSELEVRRGGRLGLRWGSRREAPAEALFEDLCPGRGGAPDLVPTPAATDSGGLSEPAPAPGGSSAADSGA